MFFLSSVIVRLKTVLWQKKTSRSFFKYPVNKISREIRRHETKPMLNCDRDYMNTCDSKTKTFNHSTKSNKWQKLREKQKSPENPLGEVCHPAGPQPAIQQPAAEAPLSQVHVDTRKVLGLQPRLFDTSIMAEGAVYLDLCLIFLLFRLSLLKQRVLITRVIHQFRRYFLAAPYEKHLTCACASFATARKVQY